MGKWFSFLGLFVILQTCVAAPVHLTVQVSDSPVLDGELNEPMWQRALVISDFLQRFPREGGEPTERTEVRLLYTSHSLFIGFMAFDSAPEELSATVLKRDDFEITKNDQFAIAIDSYNDARNGYWFSTNPIGARVDAQFFDEGNVWEPNWDGVWSCATNIRSSGWSAEIQIPFSTLRFRPAERNIMGINLFRRIIRTNEQLFAPLIPLKYANGTPNVSAARKYSFEQITGRRQWQMKPHVVSGFEKDAASTNDFDVNAGLDTKYALTDSLTGNFSLNTDFAEAEVDERRINLSRFRLFFPEKRDFFLENAGNFQFGIPGQTELFFSRRIGLSEEGETVPVLFGAKLTGKIDRFDVGVLNSQTKESNESPAENFSVVRVKSALGERSYAGALFTGRHNKESSFSGTYGMDFNLYVAGETTLSGFAAATHDRDSHGNAYHVALGRGGERASYRLAFTQLDESFDPAVGFVQRTGIRQMEGHLFVPFYFNDGFLRSITPGFETRTTSELTNKFTDAFQRASVKFVTPSEDQLLLYSTRTTEHVPVPFSVFRNVFVLAGEYTEIHSGFEFNSKPGRQLSGGLIFNTGGFYGGSRTEITPFLLWKMNRHFTFTQFVSTNFVEMNNDQFRIDLLRSQISYSLNTHLSASALIQYDNSTRQTGVNLRCGYLFREGTELFVVYDQLQDQGRRLLTKLTYLFAF